MLEKYHEGGYSLNLLEIALPAAQRLSNLTYAELRDRLGIPAEEIHSFYRAAGLPLPDPNQPARIDEIEAFENYAVIRSLPIPADARLHAMRVTGDSLRRAAEVQSQLFREHVVHPLLEHQTLKNATELMEEAVGEGEIGSHRAGDPTVVFVDLVGFTVLSADLGDSAAAELAAKFNDQLMDTSLEHHGRVIKTMGDGAMLFFESAPPAVLAALDLLEQLPRAGLPPLRVGIHRGPVVAQSGDYYGNTVNLAARITDYARPNEVLVPSSVLPEPIDGVELEEIGEVTLKGVAQPVRLSRARRACRPPAS